MLSVADCGKCLALICDLAAAIHTAITLAIWHFYPAFCVSTNVAFQVPFFFLSLIETGEAFGTVDSDGVPRRISELHLVRVWGVTESTTLSRRGSVGMRRDGKLAIYIPDVPATVNVIVAR